MIACSRLGCHLDYANSVLLVASATSIKWLQIIQNTLAQVVTHKTVINIFNALKDLHWLPVSWLMNRLQGRNVDLTYRVLKTSQPFCLASRIDITLRLWADIWLLVVPSTKPKIGSRGSGTSFTWNHPPFDVHTTPSLLTLKSRLKTFYFQQAFNWFHLDFIQMHRIRLFVSCHLAALNKFM